MSRSPPLFRDIDENGTRPEHRDRLAAAARLGVDDRRHVIVGRDAQELGPELEGRKILFGQTARGEPIAFPQHISRRRSTSLVVQL